MDKPLTKEEIQGMHETYLCPRCHKEYDYISIHERDSSNDYRTCHSCKWTLHVSEW